MKYTDINSKVVLSPDAQREQSQKVVDALLDGGLSYEQRVDFFDELVRLSKLTSNLRVDQLISKALANTHK